MAIANQPTASQGASAEGVCCLVLMMQPRKIISHNGFILLFEISPTNFTAKTM
jgi:hypothetical protein